MWCPSLTILVGLQPFVIAKFDLTSIFVMAPIAIAAMMEHIGDMSAISATVGKNFLSDPGLHRTLIGDGIATSLSGLFGGPANTTYGENTGVLVLSRVHDPRVVRLAAIYAVVLSFSPAFAAVVNSIPTAIIGGVSFILYGMISAIGVSYLLQNLALLIFGSEQKATPTIFKLPTIELGGVYIDGITLITLVVTAIIMICLTLFIGKTRMGKAMRACSEDKGAAQLMGINVNRTISLTFAIGSALAAIAGVLLCSFNTSLMPTTGSMPGVLLGIIESLAKAYISTQLANSIVFAVLIVTLLVRPAGLLGKYVPEKV